MSRVVSRNPDLRGNKDDVAVSLDSRTTMATNNVATSWQINWKFHLTIKKIVRSMSKTTIPNQWLIKSLPRQQNKTLKVFLDLTFNTLKGTVVSLECGWMRSWY